MKISVVVAVVVGAKRYMRSIALADDEGAPNPEIVGRALDQNKERILSDLSRARPAPPPPRPRR